MKMNNPYYIHFRAINNFGDPAPKGGLSVAYMMTSTGDIVVSKPAVCDITDRFNKKEARRIAGGHLVEGKYIARISASEISAIAASGFIRNNSSYLVGSLYQAVLNKFMDSLKNDGIQNTMSLRFFDNVVRYFVSEYYRQHRNASFREFFQRLI